MQDTLWAMSGVGKTCFVENLALGGMQREEDYNAGERPPLQELEAMREPRWVPSCTQSTRERMRMRMHMRMHMRSPRNATECNPP